ncbi:thiol-disulfide oxidoreductase DCC family protein [Polaribacter sp. R77954]|uniref:thiol-disulfide oxidoreductase DCC family protein n=1 Tax=Polaribacter sp. R77954 TaxID=3093870 RepID=UPI0037C84524
MIDIPEHKKLILFDGVCNLCNKAVLSVIKYDKKNTFLFASLQSEIGKKVATHLHVDIDRMDSIILLDPGVAYYIKSTAVLNIMKDFGGIWIITQIGFLLPETFRNHIYDFIAANRYKWFGKKESCLIPTPEIIAKFIE